MNRAARLGLLAALSVPALPACALAEGNRLAFACAPLAPDADTTSTEAAAPLPDHPAFILAPVKTDRDGAGQIQVTGPNGHAAPGVANSFRGPFAWTSGTILNTLTVEGAVADGRSLVFWHRLDQAQTKVPPVGTLTKLICEVS